MALSLPQTIIDALIDQARNDAPLETCGYLAGTDGVVTVRVPLQNVDASAEHYSFDPKAQFEAVRNMRKEGVKPLAVYHSHPATPARMSQEDIRLANDPDMSYIIVSLEGEKAVIKSFRVINKVVQEEELVIT